jgi:DHA2 family multidrug resistance protein
VSIKPEALWIGVNTSWESQTRYVHAELSGLTDQSGSTTEAMTSAGMGVDQARGIMDWMLQGQSVMVATNKIFMAIAVLFTIAAFAIWLAPRPTKIVDTSAVH